MRKLLTILGCSLLATAAQAQTAAPVPPATPRYRPAYHFTPAAHWMNDPNGMVYYQGTYYLFFQYYPGGMVWGPMHWGHATSPDMLSRRHRASAVFRRGFGRAVCRPGPDGDDRDFLRHQTVDYH